MNSKVEHYTLLVIAAFAALSAIVGGFGVATSNGLGMPSSWLRTTPFADYTVPGLILLVVVGGSAFLATILLLVRHPWQDLMACGAGAIMVGWIVGEVLLLQQISWLQPLYLVVGLAMMGLSLLEQVQKGRHQTRHGHISDTSGAANQGRWVLERR